MKKLWFLSLVTALFLLVGCAQEEAPPVTNPTGEKAADDKAAAGASGATADPDVRAADADATAENKKSEKSALNSGPAPGEALPKSSDPAQPVAKEKPADDANVPYKQDRDAGKGLPPPGTPVKSGS